MKNTKRNKKTAIKYTRTTKTAKKKSPATAYTLGAVTNKRIYNLVNLEATLRGCSASNILCEMLNERYSHITR